MKRVVLIILLVVLSFSLVEGASSINWPELSVSLVSQSPDPVEPGQTVKVKFKIENDGAQTKNEVVVKLLPKHPFSLYGSPVEVNLGKLPAGLTGSDAIVVAYNLKIAEDAVEKATELELELLRGDSGVKYDQDEFLIDIETHDAVLDISSVIYDPEQITPGEEGKVTLIVKNLADSLLKDIRVQMDFSDSALPLAPYKSSSERILRSLNSQFQNSLTFTFIAKPDATPGLYKVPLNITYNDERGTSYSIDDVLAVKVGGSPKVIPFIKKSTERQASSETKLTLSLANAGATDIKFAELVILPSEDFELLNPSNYFYIGDIDSDDTESEEIDLFVNKKLKKLILPVRLKYSDANNKGYQQQFNLEMNLYSSAKLKKYGLKERSKAGFYLLILILGASAYYWYRRNKKKKPSR